MTTNARASCWTRRKKVWYVTFIVVITGIGIGVLIDHQQRAFAERTHCVGNLVHIRLAKSACQKDLGFADGDSIPEKVLEQEFKKNLGKPLAQYKCPNGGDYVIGKIGTLPQCTYTNVCYTYNINFKKLKLEVRAWKHTLDGR